MTVSLDEGGKTELPTAAVAQHKPGCPHLAPGEAGAPAKPEAGQASSLQQDS